MARTNTLGNFLTDVATAIKTKKGDDTPILASDFDTEIGNLPSGGGDTTEDEMRKYDLMEYWYGVKALIAERDYTQSEVEKVDNLLTLLEGGNV